MPQESHYKNAILENSFEWFYYKSPPEAITLHEHDFHEMYIFLSGDIQFQMHCNVFKLEPGDIVIAPRAVLHTPIFKGDEPYERIVIWVKPEYVKALSTRQTDLTSCFSLQNKPMLFKGGEKIGNEIYELLKDLHEDAYGSDLKVQMALMKLLLYVNENTESFQLEQREPEGFAPLTHYIRTHLQEDLSLDFLAEQCYFSKYHLLREFKQKYGITLHRYIVKERLVLAKRLLLEDHSTSSVSVLCGFSDYSGFLAAFKREYNITPTAFQKLMKP